MEINDYLKVVSKRSRFIGAVALAALVLSIATYVLEPPRYKATATVVIPAPTGTTSLIAGVSQAVSDFDGAISSDAVAARVADVTGVDKGTIKSGLSFDRLVSSSVAEVSFEGRTAEEAEVVVREASRQALGLLLEANLAPYEEQRAFAADQLTKAQEDLQAFYAETGIVDAARYFENQSRRILDLRNQIGAARAAGDEVGAVILEQRLATKQAEIAQQLADYNRVTASQQRAQALVTEVEGAYSGAKASLDSTQSPDAIDVSDAERVSQVSSLLRSIIPAVVIATGLAIAFVVLLELTRYGGRSNAADDVAPVAVRATAPTPTARDASSAAKASRGTIADPRGASTTGASTPAGRGTSGPSTSSDSGSSGQADDEAVTADHEAATVASEPSRGPTPQKAGPSR